MVVVPLMAMAVQTGWVYGDRGLYRRCGSPSLDRYHGHRGFQVVVRDVGPDIGGLPLPRPTTSSGPW
jgi:hypothetical protein